MLMVVMILLGLNMEYKSVDNLFRGMLFSATTTDGIWLGTRLTINYSYMASITINLIQFRCCL